MEQRKILFKAKKLGDGEWVKGDLGHSASLNKGVQTHKTTISAPIYTNHGEILGYSVYEVDPSTVCQFTGIYDKDGKEIFENSLVQDVQTKVVHVVVWNPVYACYSFLDEKENRYAAKNFADYPSKDMLIVGNKFDRKEGEK